MDKKEKLKKVLLITTLIFSGHVIGSILGILFLNNDKTFNDLKYEMPIDTLKTNTTNINIDSLFKQEQVVKEFNLEQFLIEREGMSNQAFVDQSGYIHIGYGHNLETDAKYKGWTKEELMALSFTDEECEEQFKIDIEEAKEAVERIRVDHKLATLNDSRVNVLIAMVFQMGASDVRGFHKFLHNLFLEQYQEAKYEMLDSIWVKQTTKRCQMLADIMEQGGVIEPAA